MNVNRADPGLSVSPGNGVVTEIGQGRLMGVGSLPHTDCDAAAAFSVGEYDIATVPSLPNRSAFEGVLAQAAASLPGIEDAAVLNGLERFNGAGSPMPFGVVRLGNPAADEFKIDVDLDGDAFAGMRAFLDLFEAIGHDGKPVKWQFVGPVTLGVALHRAGLDVGEAFPLAARTVRENIVAIREAISTVLPMSDQIVVLDEPSLTALMSPSFPIAPEEADDFISTAMAAAGDALAGVHCCGPCDIATLLASGPKLISVPVHVELLEYAGYLARFLDDGGLIAWGVVPVDRPVGPSSERYWQALAALWCSLVERGVDATLLRRNALITPMCGLAGHQVSVARRLSRIGGEVARKVKDQAAATHFALGA